MSDSSAVLRMKRLAANNRTSREAKINLYTAPDTPKGRRTDLETTPGLTLNTGSKVVSFFVLHI